MEWNAQNMMRAGDIALVTSAGPRSLANRLAQSIDRERPAKFSHVAMADGPGGFFHADTTAGVEFIYFEDFLDRYQGRYMAIRHPELFAWANADFSRFYAEAAYFFGQDYIREIQFRTGSFMKGAKKFAGADLEFGETFCSYLLNDFLKRSVPTLALNKERPYPVDFQNLIHSAPWIDVTEGHTLFFELRRGDPEMRKVYNDIQEGLVAVRKGMKEQDQIQEILLMLVKVSKLMDEVYGTKMPLSDADFTVKSGPLKFWDQKYGTGDDDESR